MHPKFGSYFASHGADPQGRCYDIQILIPTTGKILVKLDTSPFSGFGNNMVRCTVVDFSQFADLYS